VNPFSDLPFWDPAPIPRQVPRKVEEVWEDIQQALGDAVLQELDNDRYDYRCPRALHGETDRRNAGIKSVHKRINALDLRRPTARVTAHRLINLLDELDAAISFGRKT
jgi:hypothetical protein